MKPIKMHDLPPEEPEAETYAMSRNFRDTVRGAGPLAVGPMVAGMPTSIAADTPEGKQLIWRMLEGEQATADTVLNTPIKICHYLVDTGNMVNSSTGEQYECPALLLLLDNDRVIRLWSPFVHRTLARYLMLVRRPPFDPPISATLTAQRSPNDPEKRFYKLLIDETVAPTPKKESKR